MKERPILFSAPMVRAILEGRKTQTRRVVKSQPDYVCQINKIPFTGKHWDKPIVCPYGQPGDRLWVRESFSGSQRLGSLQPSLWPFHPLWYWADGEPDFGDWTKPKPSIHMPRWASRITLEIVSVRVERLNDISEEDAKAEGAGNDCPVGHLPSYQRSPHVYCFAQLWESINGAGSWQANPWVWVVEFKGVQP